MKTPLLQQDFEVLDLTPEHAPAVVRFADRYIGTGYYKLAEAEELIRRSWMGDTTSSMAIKTRDSNGPLLAIRLSLPPGRWMGDFDHGKHFPERWGVKADQVAYFKSLFLDESIRGQRIGPYLSSLAISRLKKMGATAVLTHAWKESPDNSSLRYLTKMGFKLMGEHPLFWSEVQYDCTGCHKRPCTCTAAEMLLNFSDIVE